MRYSCTLKTLTVPPPVNCSVHLQSNEWSQEKSHDRSCRLSHCSYLRPATCFPHVSSPCYLAPPRLSSCSHTFGRPPPLSRFFLPSNLNLGATLPAPTHSHQAFQSIPTGCSAYLALAFHTHNYTHRSERTQGSAHSHDGE